MTTSSQAAWADDAAPVFSKASYAYETMRRKILEGTYQPGERLRLAQLARELSLSEMPVREALRLLQREGLVVIHLHRGAEVAKLSFQHGLDVTEARMTLERVAALGAMPYHDAVSLAELDRLLAQMERAVARPVKFALKNRGFCTALFAPCPNAFIRQLIEELWDQVWQATSTSVFDVLPHRVRETLEESRTIVTHLRNGAAGQLEAALDDRMQNTLAAWRGVIDSAPTPMPGSVEPGPPLRSSIRAKQG